MRCFVTGASGFIGANLVHALNARGHAVRALLRPGADLRGLAGAEYEPVRGDLADRAALAQGLRGCDWCFHVAASYHLWLPDYRPLYAANVDGTRHVLEAAWAAGCRRLVHTSSVACLSPARRVGGRWVPGDETRPAAWSELGCAYQRSKWEAERVALDLAARGAPVVVVNPSAPVGPRDVRPTPTGALIRDFLAGRLPGYLDTGFNWVHVADVAEGHVLAAERGRVGERYLLGCAEGNWTLQETLAVLAELTGKPAPTLRVPYAVAWLAAVAGEGAAWWTGRCPRAPLAGVRMAAGRRWFSPAKAVGELGLPQTPPRRALAEAVEWFRAGAGAGAGR
ncbi:MAG: NAD-dependent nucleoside diphosphate-sugar epimerase/dehydratase [Verrucomicrobiota bacterium]|jgi:dihydroflavonol-4-reductase